MLINPAVLLKRVSLPVAAGQVDEDCVGVKRRKIMGQFSRRSSYVVKSVEEITEEDLDNIAYRAKDKIWDKDNVRNSAPLPH